eukprot:15324936-Ditylum_brightwellii.AAC.1
MSQAPLVYWYYVLMFVIDCLNHLAKKPLSWRTSTFRYSFWQKIKYFELTAKFPDQQWRLGQFLGIAWDSEDLEENDQEDTTNQDVGSMVNSPTDIMQDHPKLDLEADPSQDTGGIDMITEQNDTTATNTTTAQNKNNLSPALITAPEQDNGDGEEPVEMVSEINDQLSRPDESAGIGGSDVDEIVAYQWRNGRLSLQ